MGNNLEIVTLKVKDIHPYKRNPRKNDQAVDAVMESIKQCGYCAPIVVDENHEVLAGHTRLKAIKKLGWNECEVVIKEGLTEEQKRKYRLLDNKTNELAEWDMELLEIELDGLDFDGFEFGFEEIETGNESNHDIVEDEVPETPENPVSKRGDIWQLGRHRLMCGDSTDADAVEKLMDGARANLCLTDPPYGINVVQNKQVGGGGALHFGGKIGKRVESSTYIPIANDDTTDTAKSNYEIVAGHTDNQVIFGGNYFTDFLPPSRCWIVWDKQNTGNFADAELAWTSFDKGVKLYQFMWNGLAREGSRKIEGKTRVHPTQKPVGLMAKILSDFCPDDCFVLDCFGGSGSTLIACEQTGRNCYMMELDPHYCDVIIQRWENLTGGKAVLING